MRLFLHVSFSRQITNVPRLHQSDCSVLQVRSFRFQTFCSPGRYPFLLLTQKIALQRSLYVWGARQFLSGVKILFLIRGRSLNVEEGEGEGKGEAMSATIRDQFQAHCAAGAESLCCRLEALLGRLRRAGGNAVDRNNLRQRWSDYPVPRRRPSRFRPR
jgi:hypothetical protein